MLSYTDLAVTVAEANTYAAARGYSDWVGNEEILAAALRRGQDYIANEYNEYWNNVWATPPEVVKYAIIEAARQELVSPGILSPVTGPDDRKVLTEVKGIKWTLVGDSSEYKVEVPAVTGLLRGVSYKGVRVPYIWVV